MWVEPQRQIPEIGKEKNNMKQHIVEHDSMYAYAADADISHYRYSCPFRDSPDPLIEAFRPVGDPDLYIDWESMYMKNGKRYVQIWWGEDTNNFILDDAVEEFCYIRYERVSPSPNSEFGEYVSDGRVYETEKAAKRGGSNVK